MKKSVLATATALMMVLSVNTASASFLSDLGSKISSSVKSVEKKVKPAPKQQQQPVQVDMQGMSVQQQKLLNTMSIGMLLVAKSNVVLNDAVGKDTNNTVAAMNLLKAEPSKKNIDNMTKVLKDSENDSKDFDAMANGTAEQKAKLKAAMEESSKYRYASYICFGLAVRDGANLVKEAGSAVKSIGLSNVSQSKELKTYMSTGNMAKSLFNQTKKGYAAYDKKANKAKQLLNPDEAKADDTEVKALAQQALDGGFNF